MQLRRIAGVPFVVLLLALLAAPAALATPCDYTTRAANLSIPDGIPGGGPLGGGGTTSSFWVPPPETFPDDALTDVNIRLDILHPFDADLDISVTHAGRTVSLSMDNGGNGQNYTGTTFDDEAAVSITGGTAPFTGSFIPQQALTAFDGLPAEGVWTIRVRDDTGTASGGGGGGSEQKLLSWGLDYAAAQCPFEMPPCDEHGNTFDSNVPSPNGGTSSLAGTRGTGMVSDVDVFIHRYTATGGTVDFVFDRSGTTTVERNLALGLSSNLVDTVFDDSGGAIGGAPYTGTFAPAQSLSAFNFTSPTTHWHLQVDNHGGAGATLGRWGVRVMVSGDGCTDPDGDVIWSTSDNCPANSNLSQDNYEFDAQGDICDADDDNDGVADTADACPMGLRTFDIGGSSPDYDTDGCRDPEDADDDNDGVADTADACPQAIKGPGGDTDGDGCKDIEDADDDGDGVADAADTCPLASDSTQADLDGDGLGDACDPDDDGDGVIDGADSCPTLSNPGRENADGDAQGNACDADDDNDGVPDAQDAFPLDPTRSKASIASPPPARAPTLSKLKISPSRFAAAKKGATLAAAKKPKVGATITFSADLDAATTFTVVQVSRGVTKGKRCVKPARGLKGKRCSLLVVRGTFSRTVKAGKVTVKFTARVGKKPKALATGSYVLRVQGRNATGAGKAVEAKFTIVKG